MILYILVLLVFLILFYIICLENKFKNNEKYTAIIIEPRTHNALEFVLENFIENLSNNWDFIIFHGNLNRDYIIKILNSNKILKNNKNRLKLINLNVDNLTIKNG